MQKNLLLVFPLLVFSLLAAVAGGWLRIGWSLPVGPAAVHHGALMVNSFLASLIFLERAVTFRQKWVLLLPFLNAVSVVFFITGLSKLAVVLFAAGSAGFVAMCGYFLKQYKELHYGVFLLGAISLFAGNLFLLFRQTYSLAVPWWMAFLLLTIVAERLELTRFLGLTDLKRAMLVTCLFLIPVGLFWPGAGGRLITGVSFAATAIWLLRYDMARHAVRKKGQHRYSGLLLLTGYAWLLVTALFLFLQPQVLFGYDAALHGFFIGFVFSMIFSHAPVILPGVTRLPVKVYRPVLYIWFILLQLSLVLRLAGDVAGNAVWRKLGGGLNGVAMLGFFVTIAVIVRQELVKGMRLSGKTQ